MNQWLARQLERSPEFTFYEWELRMHCPEYQELIADGYLFRDLKAESSEFCFTKWGRRLQLLRIEGSIFGTDTDDPDEPIAEVNPRDIIRYRFNWEPWLQKVRERNGINGSSTWLDKYLLFLGQRTDSGRKLGFVLGFFNHRDEAMNLLLGLPARMTSNYDALAVTTLCFDRLPQQDMANLERLHVYVVPPINPRTLEVDTIHLPPKEQPSIPVVLSANQEEEFLTQAYKCRLPIVISGEIAKWHRNKVLVNGFPVFLGDSLFLLFLRLVLGMHKSVDGAVTKAGLRSGGFAKAGSEEQTIGHLRASLTGVLGDYSSHDLIETYRRGAIRLSTHPALVKYNKDKLTRHHNEKVRRLAAQLP